MQTPTAPLSTLKSPPPKIPPMKKIPLQAPANNNNNNNGPNPLSTPQLPPPPPAAKNFPSQQENSNVTAANNSTYCTNASLLRSGRLLRLSAVANSSTTSTSENGAASGVGSPRDSSHHRTTSSFSLDKANNNNSSNSVAAAEAVIAALLSKQGAFSEALRLDKSRKPVATFEPMDQSKWVPDGVSSVCMSPVCEIPFSLFTRRHHCRSCGLIFCSACLKHTLTVSSTPDQQATPSTATYRVCAVCFFIHQLAITQNFFSASANNINNNKNKYVTTDHQHSGAHPFTECLTRSDLIKQVRYVSVDGGTSYRPTTSNNNIINASSVPVGPQQTPQSNKTNNSTPTTIIISPSASAFVVKNHQNNSNSKSEDRVGDEAEEEERAKSISPRQQPHHHHHEAENDDNIQMQQNHQHRQQPKRNQQPQAKPTYVSYWSSEQRLNAMQRRGKLRAFPWSILVSIAEFLPLINNADENESNNSITNFSKIDEADSLNESLNNDNASCMNDSGTAIRNSQFRKGGLFSFSLVCSDFYFAARANSVWNQWLNRLRTEGTWMIIPNDEVLPEQRLQRQQSKNAKSKIDTKIKNSNNSAKERQDNNTHNIVVDNLTMSATRKIGSNITNNIDGFEERTFSLNAFDSTGLSPVVTDLVPNNSNSSQQDRTVNNNNNNNNAAASSSSATTTTTSAAGSFYFSPPFSVFAEFVTEAAFHRANQLSASGARLHKLFANGIRLTFAGDEEQLKNNLVRGFALGDLAFLNNNNSNTQQQQQPMPTSSSANDLTFSPLAENTEYDAQTSAPSFSSPTTRTNNNNNNNNNNAILNQTSYPAPLPPPPPSNTNGCSGGRNNNINNGSLMNSSLFASSVLGFSTFNQLVHVALSGGGGSSNDFEHSQEIVGVRQSFVRMYNVKSGRRYWKIARLAARSSHAVVVCYDATSRDSLTHAALYFTEVVATSLNPKTTLRILCGVIPNNSTNNNNSNLISPETALAFVGCSASNLSIASLTVSASDPVGAVESIVQAVFSRTLRGDPTPSGPGVITSAATPTNGSAAVANGGVVGNNNQKEDILTVPTVLDILCSDGADLVQ